MDSINLVVVSLSFTIYTLFIIGVGIYSMRYSQKSDDDFFLAGRGLGVWIAAFSASASSESGWVTLGLVGWAFTEGIKAYWIIPGCLLGFAFNWFILAGPIRQRSETLDALTLPDLFALHFRERYPVIRSLSVLVIMTAMTLYVAAQFAAAGKAFSTVFTGLDYSFGVLIGAFIVLIYTVSGGFRAVCWTDFLQALLMIFALICFPIYLIIKMGGISPILVHLPATMMTFTPDKAGIAFVGFLLGSGALGINFGYPGQPHVLIRFMALKNRADVYRGGIIAITWGFFIYLGAVTVGIIARSLAFQGVDWTGPMLTNPDIYGELGLILSAMHLLPGIFSGLVLAAVLAAICSTADSQLVVAASAAAHDLGKRVFRTVRFFHSTLFDRMTVLVLGVIAVSLVINQEIRVYKYVLTYGWAILGASFGPQLILILFWKRASYYGCIAGMIVGFLGSILWQQFYDASATGIEIYNLPLAFISALCVNVTISIFTSRKILQES